MISMMDELGLGTELMEEVLENSLEELYLSPLLFYTPYHPLLLFFTLN